MALTEVEKRYPVKLNQYCKVLTEHSEAAAKMYLPDARELDSSGLSDDGEISDKTPWNPCDL